LLSGAGERIGEPGRDHEARTGAAGLVKLVLIQHGAGAHDRARDGRHFADHIERRRCAERDLEHGEASRDQGFGDRAGMSGIFDHQHGDDRRRAHDVINRHASYLSAKAAAAPNKPGCG
jgi:hypothetical protein